MTHLAAVLLDEVKDSVWPVYDVLLALVPDHPNLLHVLLDHPGFLLVLACL